jgi:hypothetical protein
MEHLVGFLDLGFAPQGRGSSVIMICTDEGDFWVVASAPTEEDLSWLDDLHLTWDEADTRLGPGE